MMSIALLSLAALAPVPASYADENVRQMKGHAPIVARADSPRAAPMVCHPDPSKGRACRHQVAKAKERQDRGLAVAVARP